MSSLPRIGGRDLRIIIGGRELVSGTLERPRPATFPVESGALPLTASGYGRVSCSLVSLVSGTVLSGIAHLPPPSVLGTCAQCRGEVPLGQPGVLVTTEPLGRSVFCAACAGYDAAKGGFGWQREEWVRQSVGEGLRGAPAGVIADWLEDYFPYRQADITYMRGRADEIESGKVSG